MIEILLKRLIITVFLYSSLIAIADSKEVGLGSEAEMDNFCSPTNLAKPETKKLICERMDDIVKTIVCADYDSIDECRKSLGLNSIGGTQAAGVGEVSMAGLGVAAIGSIFTASADGTRLPGLSNAYVDDLAEESARVARQLEGSMALVNRSRNNWMDWESARSGWLSATEEDRRRLPRHIREFQQLVDARMIIEPEVRALERAGSTRNGDKVYVEYWEGKKHYPLKEVSFSAYERRLATLQGQLSNVIHGNTREGIRGMSSYQNQYAVFAEAFDGKGYMGINDPMVWNGNGRVPNYHEMTRLDLDAYNRAWQASDDLAKELAKKNPDPERVASLMKSVDNAFSAERIVQQGIPPGGVGFFADTLAEMRNAADHLTQYVAKGTSTFMEAAQRQAARAGQAGAAAARNLATRAIGEEALERIGRKAADKVIKSAAGKALGGAVLAFLGAPFLVGLMIEEAAAAVIETAYCEGSDAFRDSCQPVSEYATVVCCENVPVLNKRMIKFLTELDCDQKMAEFKKDKEFCKTSNVLYDAMKPTQWQVKCEADGGFSAKHNSEPTEIRVLMRRGHVDHVERIDVKSVPGYWAAPRFAVMYEGGKPKAVRTVNEFAINRMDFETYQQAFKFTDADLTANKDPLKNIIFETPIPKDRIEMEMSLNLRDAGFIHEKLSFETAAITEMGSCCGKSEPMLSAERCEKYGVKGAGKTSSDGSTGEGTE